MDGIQAAVLRIKLRHLDDGNRLRQAHAQRYDAAFAEVPQVIVPARSHGIGHVYHLYAVRVRERDAVMELLHSRGIGCGIHYPVPIHQQKAYEHLAYPVGAFPVSERCAPELLSLPMFPELTPEQVDYVAESIRAELA